MTSLCTRIATLLFIASAVSLVGCEAPSPEELAAVDDIEAVEQPILGENCTQPAAISSSLYIANAAGGFFLNDTTKVIGKGYARIIFYVGSPQNPVTDSYDITGCLCFDVAPSEQSEAQYYFNNDGSPMWFQNQRVMPCSP